MGTKGRGRDEGIGVNFHRHQGSSTPNNFTANLVMHLSTPNILSIFKVYEDKSVVAYVDDVVLKLVCKVL